MKFRSPEGAGIKGGWLAYHTSRMLQGFAFLHTFPLDAEFISKLIHEHAVGAAHAALNRIYNGRRPQ